MKRFILLSLCLFVAVGVVLLLSQERAGSVVTGPCSNCHTMHDSQNGAQVTTGGPYAFLLKGDCIWCHSGATGPTNNNAPIVWHTTEPSPEDTVYGRTGPGKTLAGGDFYWVNAVSDAKGHNVAGIANQDANLNSYTPPGWDPNATANYAARGQVAGGEDPWTNQLTCFGTYGCHGTNSGLGGHHTNVNRAFDDTANTVANSYRFLYGIKGYEDPDWEWTATDHNDYKAAAGNQSYADKSTISYLCAECHGVFHQQTGPSNSYGTGSPWYRHPTDFTLPTQKEYPSDATYVVNVPVGRNNAPANKDQFSAGVDQVICLSCHRAHGSDFDDLLRWNYSLMNAGTPGGSGAGKGCFVCHTQKDD